MSVGRRTLSVQRALARATGLGGPRDTLLLVVDEAGWILDHVARELQRAVSKFFPCQVVGSEWQAARNCTVHFIHRAWAWSDGVLDVVHPSNRLIGLWWHGRDGSPHPGIQPAVERLKRLHARFDRIQVTCTIGRDALLEMGIPAAKVVRLPEGVDLAPFALCREGDAKSRSRRRLRIPDDAFVVGCFQKDGDGMDEGHAPKMIKGPDVLVDVLALVKRQRPVFALLPGPARGYVKARLTNAGIPFCAPGFVSRDELPAMYAALDAYLSPSRDEGGPAGLLEAMASGVPVVSTRSGMAPDLIDHAVNGILADVDDRASLASGLLWIAEDPLRAQRMAAAAADAVRVLDWPVLAARYAKELYAPLMPRSQPR